MKKAISFMEAIDLVRKYAGKSDYKSLYGCLAIKDPMLSIALLPKIISHEKAIPPALMRYAMLLAPKSAYVRRNLIKPLRACGEFEQVRALKGFAQDQLSFHLAEQQYLLAHAQHRAADVVRACETLYVETGDITYLQEAAEEARDNLGWHRAWGYYFRLTLIDHSNYALHLFSLLHLLDREDAREEFKQVTSAARKLGGFDGPLIYAAARIAMWSGEHAKAIDIIESSGVLKPTKKDNSLFYKLLAISYEKNGSFRKAFENFQKQNDKNRDDRFQYTSYINHLETNAHKQVADLPADDRTDCFVQTGFPRTGTTLLENALNSHEGIETIEESGALISTFRAAEQVSEEDKTDKNSALRHRELYYDALEQRRKKPSAVLIDKTPILSADIHYMEKLFPAKRYIFSVRHPYDVVLSNFKQRYHQNAAMAAFNEFWSSCDFYNYVMKNWFEVFPGETDRVCYVYYDELVTDFEPTVRRVINFLGVEWDDAVLDFAEHSKKRAVRTPSYANVRKGLSLGVQSSYQNYLFLFDDYCRSKLDPWVEFFGYTVEEPKQ